MEKGIGKGYRIPKLEEFIEGFKFERRHDYAFGFITDGVYKKKQEYTQWIPMEVWWKKDPTKFYTSKLSNGITLTQSGYTINWFKPFNEQSFIDQKLVRVKINNNE